MWNYRWRRSRLANYFVVGFVMDIVKILIEIAKSGNIKIIVLVVVLLFVFYGIKLGYQFISKVIATYKFPQAAEIKTKDLINHRLFRELACKISYDIKHLKIDEPLRQAIFRDFIGYEFEAIRDGYLKLIASDLDELTNDELKNKLTETIIDIINNYEAKARQGLIPEIVISKFNEWHKDRINQLRDCINEICEDPVLRSNAFKVKVFFDFNVWVIFLTINDAAKTLIYLNGELSNQTYKGIKCAGYSVKK